MDSTNTIGVLKRAKVATLIISPSRFYRYNWSIETKAPNGDFDGDALILPIQLEY